MLTPLPASGILSSQAVCRNEVHPEDDVLQLCSGVARGDQRGRDRPADVPATFCGRKVVFLEDGEGPGEADPFDPSPSQTRSQ